MKFKIIILLSFCLSFIAFGQDFNFTVESKNPSCKRCNDGEITLTITEGNPQEFVCILYKGNPFIGRGKEIDRKENLSNDPIIFNDLKKGDYVIGLQKSSNNFKFNSVILRFKNSN